MQRYCRPYRDVRLEPTTAGNLSLFECPSDTSLQSKGRLSELVVVVVVLMTTVLLQTAVALPQGCHSGYSVKSNLIFSYSNSELP